MEYLRALKLVDLRDYIMKSIGLGHTSRGDFCRRARLDNINVYTSNFKEALNSLIQDNYVESSMYVQDFLLPSARFHEWESPLEVVVTEELPNIVSDDEIANYFIHLVEEKDARPTHAYPQAIIDVPLLGEYSARRISWFLVDMQYLDLTDDMKLTKGALFDHWDGVFEYLDQPSDWC